MKKGTFKIRVYSSAGHTFNDKKGLIGKYFAVGNKSPEDYGFSVTHLETGFRITSFDKQKQAKKFIELADKIEDIENLSVENAENYKNDLYSLSFIIKESHGKI